MDGWNIDGHFHSMSQLQSQVLQTHLGRIENSQSHGVKIPQASHASALDTFRNEEFGVNSSILRANMEKLSLHGAMDSGMEIKRTQLIQGFMDVGNVNLGNLDELMKQSRGAGDMSMSMRSERTQMITSSKSSTVQKEASMMIPPGSMTSTQMNFLDSDIQHEVTGMARTSGLVQSVQSKISLGGGSAGVTRSFSTSSRLGLPPLSMNMDECGSVEESSETGVDGDSASAIATLHNSGFPFRRPFGFRNFDRPLWMDLSRSVGDNQMLNRMTWDPSTIQSSQIFSSQVQFSATKTLLQSIGGSLREYDEGKMFLRQSYGASESESEDDDDGDEIKFLGHSNLKAICGAESNNRALLEIQDTPSECPTEHEQSPTSSIGRDTTSISPEHNRCHKVAQELLSTEITYVNILHLIDQVFHFRVDQENRVQPMFPPDTVKQMFCNVKSLYKLHNDHLLPQLQKRLSEWKEDNPRIGDIMKDFSPFLKMYTEYVQNFDHSINLINLYKEKSSRFSNIINDVQKLETCANLPIQHHLISPIQRIPRYRLLLEAYLQKLPESSPDRADSIKALEIVSKAAEHANEAMRTIASFKKLLEVQENVKGAVDLISPTRVLIKEGKVSKISARSSDHQERYIFLFSDTALLCSIRPIANRMISSAPYQLRAKLDVAELSVNEGDDLEVVNTFYIQDTHKRIELYTPTTDEKCAWMEALWQARVDLLQRKSSLKLGSPSPPEDLGLKLPAKIKTQSVSKCMECGASFTMLKRRHHCHACGSVVCAKCSAAKVPLKYAGGKPCRVCDSCKKVLEERESSEKHNSDSEPSSCSDILEFAKTVLDVPASAQSVLSGYLSLRLRGKKVWNPRWFSLRQDFVLYCYAKDTDQQAMTATPMPGMNVELAESLPKSESYSAQPSEKERVFRIAHEHGRKVFFLLASNRQEAADWVNVLQQASKAELSVRNSV